MKTRNIICYFILFPLFSMAFVSEGQTYTSMITSPEDDIPLGLIADHSNGSYLVTWRGTFDPYETDPTHYFDNYRNIIYHLDEQVEIMDSIEVDMLGGYDWELWDLYLAGDSLMAWGTAYNEANASCHLGLLWLDEDLQVLDYRIHGNFSDSAQFIDFTIDNLGNMIFAGYHGWTNALYLIKTDRSGEFVMENAIPMWGIPYPNICYLPTNDQLMCGRFNWIGFVNNSDLTADTFYLPEFFTHGFHGDGWYIGYDESSVILPGLSIEEPPEYGWNFSCVVFDSIAQVRDSVVFYTSFDQNVTMEVDYNTTDSIYFSGLENYVYINPDLYEFDPIDRYYYISMFNFNGDKFWALHLGGDANYSIMCLAALKNNDCLVAGARYDWRNNTNLERDIILYKINSGGILVNTPEMNESEIRIFPNPASDYINIQVEDDISDHHLKSTINIHDVFGNIIYAIDCEHLDDFDIDVSEFVPGIYILKFKMDTNHIISRKIIIL